MVTGMTSEPVGMLSLPTPLARLYGTAMAMRWEVRDMTAGLAAEDPDAAAVVACAHDIVISPGLDDDLGADRSRWRQRSPRR